MIGLYYRWGKTKNSFPSSAWEGKKDYYTVYVGFNSIKKWFVFPYFKTDYLKEPLSKGNSGKDNN